MTVLANIGGAYTPHLGRPKAVDTNHMAHSEFGGLVGAGVSRGGKRASLVEGLAAIQLRPWGASKILEPSPYPEYLPALIGNTFAEPSVAKYSSLGQTIAKSAAGFLTGKVRQPPR